MRTNLAGQRLIRLAEGLRLNPYDDAVGLRTVGFGHQLLPGEPDQPITTDQAEAYLKADIERTEEGVLALVKVPLTDNQLSALVSFAFNVGLGNLKKSTLLKRLNQADIEGASQEFLKWTYAGTIKLKGLEQRRVIERKLFLMPEKPLDKPPDS